MRGRTTWGTAALALWAALTIGGMGAQVGAWLGWRAAPPLPSDATAVELARDAAPELSPGAVVRHDVVFGYEYPDDKLPAVWIVGTDEGYVPGAVQVSYPAEAVTRELADRVPQRLRAAGWQVGGVPERVTAYRDGWHLLVDVEPGSYFSDEPPSLTVSVVRAEPRRVWWGALAGFLLGAPAGWWLAGAVRRTVPGRGGPMLLAPVLFLLSPQVMLSATALFQPLWRDPTAPPEAAWGVNNELGASCCAGLAGLLFAGLLVSLVARRHRPAERTVPAPVRLRAALFRENLRP